MSQITAVEILNDILAFDRLEEGRLDLRKEDTAIVPFLQESIRLFKPMATENKIELREEIMLQNDDKESDVESSRFPIAYGDCLMIDVFKMRQVLRNLLSNALKFSPPNGVVIMKAWLTSPLHNPINGAPLTRTLNVSISDTGVGIDVVNQSRVFHEVFQFRPEVLLFLHLRPQFLVS